MTEELLHFIWKYKLLKPGAYSTTDNTAIEFLHYGQHNSHAGPDFLDARIKINHTEWAGSIEMHKKSSDWFLHQHHTDKAYDNVVLHVVYEHDKEIYNSKQQAIPCFEIKKYVPNEVLLQYEKLYSNKQKIPCGSLFCEVAEATRELWLERVLIERMESKTQFIEEIFAFTQYNWDETFYLLLCKNFGFHVNSEAFFQLGKSIPLTLLLKHTHNLNQVEALLYGQSGLLHEKHKDSYPQQLHKEYQYLQHKYRLHSINNSLKFLRLRPKNFPSIRLAQLAGFILKYQHTFSKIVEAKYLQEAKKLFEVSVSGYWKTHYTFDTPSTREEKPLGTSSIENIMINTVCPILFFYGKQKQDDSLSEKAVKWYYQLKTEKNSLVALFFDVGFKALHAAHSQALLQLHQNYCAQKKCLQCGIGLAIVGKR
ncbi:MAG: DUF2851 family protein [Bacteroidetes bacterium]|nr:DUF2851 family protein [Bacteroidota bacterium]